VETIVPGARRPSGRHRMPDAPRAAPRLWGRITRVVMRAGLVAGSAAAVLVVLVHVVGWSTLIVRSGSMEPAVPVGGLVVARPVSGQEVHVGDPIVVQRPGAQGPVAVLHRVVALQERNGQLFAQLKGDANRVPDADLAALDRPLARPVLVLPGVGYAVAYLRGLVPSSRVLLIAVGALGLCLIWSGALPSRRTQRRPPLVEGTSGTLAGS
jgi:signal peptidase